MQHFTQRILFPMCLVFPVAMAACANDRGSAIDAQGGMGQRTGSGGNGSAFSPGGQGGDQMDSGWAGGEGGADDGSAGMAAVGGAAGAAAGGMGGTDSDSSVGGRESRQPPGPLELAPCPLVDIDRPQDVRESTDQIPALSQCASEIFRNVDYWGDGINRHQLDLYLPKPKPNQPVPVVIQIHGGGWFSGSKEANPMRIAWLLQAGIAVASANYRLVETGTTSGSDPDRKDLPAAIIDLQTVVRWIRANADRYGLDGDHIGAWGGSAGGHLTALLATAGDHDFSNAPKPHSEHSSKIQAAAPWYGLHNLISIVEQQQPERRESRRSRLARALGNGQSYDNLLDEARAQSPITYIDADDPPVYLMHGDQDFGVPLAQGTEFFNALKAAGVEANFKIIEGSGHGSDDFFLKTNTRLIQEFFHSHLK